MTAPFGRLALIAIAASGAVALSARAQEAPRLDWRLEREDGQVQLTLAYRTEHSSSSTSHTADFAQFAGLNEAQLASPMLSTVRFTIRRDAGQFDCDGSARADRASGTCDFHANLAFAGVLKAKGYGAAEPFDLFQLAYADIGRAYLDELARQGYAATSVDDLRRAGQHGVSLAYLREMDRAGYRADSLPGLMRLRDHGISVRYVQDLKAAGYAHPSLEELLRARDHGVSASFITALADQGYRGLPLETLVRLRDHGVSASFAARANAQAAPAGQRLLPDELIRLRDHGGLYAASAPER
jgi:hypothetical protein